MSVKDFELFDKLNKVDVVEKEKEAICKHENMTQEAGMLLCVECGQELENDVNREKDWRYYGNVDNRHSSDPNRCHIRKNEERTIFKDVENMGFSDKIIHKANKIYIQCTDGKIYRGNSRKAIIFACIFHAYKLSGKPQTCDTLISVFNIDRRSGLKGLKHVNLNVPKTSPIRTTYITPEHLIEELMNKFSSSEDQKKEVIELYNQVKNKSSKLNRARPQSCSAALIYYYICKNNLNIPVKEFTKRVGLSELTVTRIAKEITEILDEGVVIC